MNHLNTAAAAGALALAYLCALVAESFGGSGSPSVQWLL